MPYIRNDTDEIAFAETNIVALNIYFTGCSIRCKDCHNKELWNMESGIYLTVKELYTKIRSYEGFVDGICILGGEPTDQIDELIQLLRMLRGDNYTGKIWLYTGRLLDEIDSKLVELCDVVKFGQYDGSKDKVKDKALGVTLASNNQYFYINPKRGS